jgi:hypothetical protein
MKIIVKILKITGLVLLGIAIIIGAIVLYFHLGKLQKEKETLMFYDNVDGRWEWHDKFNNIQIGRLDSGKLALRKVHMDDGYAVYAYKNEDRSLTTAAVFISDCQPNTEITTSQKFSDGAPKTLRCNKNGSALVFSCNWESGNAELWEENLDGFKIREYLSRWDFTKLDQEITLAKAKKKTDPVIENVTEKDTAKAEEETMPENTAKTEEETVPENPVITAKELAAEDQGLRNNLLSVFTNKNSNIFHKRDCPRLNTNDDIVGFSSSQNASKSGGLPCNYCNAQTSTPSSIALEYEDIIKKLNSD